jgi:WD40 repeat protein
VGGDRRLARPFTAGIPTGESDQTLAAAPGFAVSPDGRTLVVARRDGRVDVINAQTLRPVRSFAAFPGRAVRTVEYAPDGRRLAVGAAGGGVGLWDAQSGQPVGTALRAAQGPDERNPADVEALAFGPDGLLAAADASGTVRTWDLRRRAAPVHELRLPPSVLGLAFTPDGARLAIAFGASSGGRGAVEVRDEHSGKHLTTLVAAGARSVAFSPDGGLLAVGQEDGRIVTWATGDWRPVGQPLALREGAVLSVAFSSNGRTLAGSQDDGRVVLWDVGSRQPIGSPLAAQPSFLVNARFTPDGRHLFTVYDNARAYRWDIDPAAWRRRACRVAHRDLTPREWDRWVPAQPYRTVCASGFTR